METLFGEALKSGNGPWFALVVILLAMQWYDRRHDQAQMLTAQALGQLAKAFEAFCSKVDAANAEMIRILTVLAERERRRD